MLEESSAERLQGTRPQLTRELSSLSGPVTIRSHMLAGWMGAPYLIHDSWVQLLYGKNAYTTTCNASTRLVMDDYRSHIDYLRAKILWDHLRELSTPSNNTSQVRCSCCPRTTRLNAALITGIFTGNF